MISELYEKVELNYKDIEPYFIYLTLIPEQIPSGEKFQNIDYKYLINNITLNIYFLYYNS